MSDDTVYIKHYLQNESASSEWMNAVCDLDENDPLGTYHNVDGTMYNPDHVGGIAPIDTLERLVC